MDDPRLALVHDYAEVFTTDVGQRVLKHLDQTFLEPDPVVLGDPYATHVKAGEARPIRHIHAMLAVAQNPALLTPAESLEEDVLGGILRH